jgi:hypothetical protein
VVQLSTAVCYDTSHCTLPLQVLFAFAMGFILKAVGPALVMQLMFELQSKRLGTDRSELMLQLGRLITYRNPLINVLRMSSCSSVCQRLDQRGSV